MNYILRSSGSSTCVNRRAQTGALLPLCGSFFCGRLPFICSFLKCMRLSALHQANYLQHLTGRKKNVNTNKSTALQKLLCNVLLDFPTHKLRFYMHSNFQQGKFSISHERFNKRASFYKYKRDENLHFLALVLRCKISLYLVEKQWCLHTWTRSDILRSRSRSVANLRSRSEKNNALTLRSRFF